MKYRKKPVVIDAWPFKADDNTTHVCPVTGVGVVNFSYPRDNQDSTRTGLHGKHWIRTLEGPLVVSSGDMIIRGVKGEYYPIKYDIFRETYESA